MRNINDTLVSRGKMMVSFASLAILMACSAEQSSAQEEKDMKPAAAKLKEMTEKSKKIEQKKLAKGLDPNKPVMAKIGHREQITRARAHLMEQKGLTSPSEVKLIKAKGVTWRSGALGCPKPGENYTQALVKGRLIILGAGDKHYRYHASQFGEPFYCETSSAESPVAEPSDI